MNDINLNDLQEINEDQSYTCARYHQYLKSSIFANLIIYLSEVKENSTINEDE
jgi:hypothetical protein